MKQIAHFKRPLFLLLSGLVTLLLAQSCGTGNNLDARPGAYNFSVTGNLYVGDTLRFQSTAPDNSIFIWTFGDGNSSVSAAPVYAYYKIAHDNLGIISDTVTLIVNNDIYHPVIKPITLKPPVPRISKTWNWAGGYFRKYGNCCPALSDHGLNDTTFSIAKVDDYIIKTWGLNLPFQADSNYFSTLKSTGKNNATYVKYTRDTLYFKQVTGDDSGGYIITYYHKF